MLLPEQVLLFFCQPGLLQAQLPQHLDQLFVACEETSLIFFQTQLPAINDEILAVESQSFDGECAAIFAGILSAASDFESAAPRVRRS